MNIHLLLQVPKVYTQSLTNPGALQQGDHEKFTPSEIDFTAENSKFKEDAFYVGECCIKVAEGQAAAEAKYDKQQGLNPNDHCETFACSTHHVSIVSNYPNLLSNDF